MKKLFGLSVTLTLLTGLLFTSPVLIQAQDFPGLSGITERHIRADLNFLASQELSGREAGKPGGFAAGVFLASRLYYTGLAGLNQAGENSPFQTYYQPFDIVGAVPAKAVSSLTIRQNGEEMTASYGKDYFYLFNSPMELDITAPAVFAGYAITAPEYHYNDFSGVDCQGKIVVAYYGEPLEKDSTVFFNGVHITRYAMAEWKARLVAQKGGKALILLPTPENREKYVRFLKRKSRSLKEQNFILKEETGVPVLYLSVEFAEKIFGKWEAANFEQERNRLRKWLTSGPEKPFAWKGSDWKAGDWSLQISLPEVETRQCRNVLAVLPGSDPQLKEEYILIGSHYDHEGIKNGKIYRGADDNASGVTANLNIARAFAGLQGGDLPKRSVIFAFWDAEEKGLRGSQYFVEHPLIPLTRIKAAFNMDMIGRDASFHFAALRKPMTDEDAENKVMLFYSAQAPELEAMARKANSEIGLHLLFDPNVFFTSGSDHMNFQAKKIPVVYYFTGFHTDYTSPTDTPDKIDYRKLTRIARHIANFAYHLGREQKVPEFNSKILTAPEGDFRRF